MHNSFVSNSTHLLRVLIVGAGGRDHALAWKFAQSPRLQELHAVPGNAGIAQVATCHPTIDPNDFDAIVALAQSLHIDLAIIGAEDQLVAGLATRLNAAGIRALGPSVEAAQLEGSKTFSKTLMDKLAIPTAKWSSFDTAVDAHAHLDNWPVNGVAVKADGVAAGCGAFVCVTRDEAQQAIDSLFSDEFPTGASDRIIIEELLAGSESSVMAIVDGTLAIPLPVARDYKRLGDFDIGPNTGGMGAHCPSTDVSEDQVNDLCAKFIQPIVDELRKRGTPFRGVIYAGIMHTDSGPIALEYNGRLGNPETQAIVRVIDADLLDLFDRATNGSLKDVGPLRARGSAVAVCMAAKHYPVLQLEPTAISVRGIDSANAMPGIELFTGMSAATNSSDHINSMGGRAITVTALADSFEEAIKRAYAAVDLIEIPGSHYRSDIGQPALSRA